MKKQNFTTPEDFHTKIGMIFNASIALPLLPFVWLILEINNNDYRPMIQAGMVNEIISYASALVSGLIVLKGFNLYKAAKVKSESEEKLKSKLEVYSMGVQIFYILVGVSCLIMATSLFFTASGVLIVSYVILLFGMSFYFPKPKQYVKDLKLEGEMKDIILNRKTFKL